MACRRAQDVLNFQLSRPLALWANRTTQWPDLSGLAPGQKLGELTQIQLESKATGILGSVFCVIVWCFVCFSLFFYFWPPKMLGKNGAVIPPFWFFDRSHSDDASVHLRLKVLRSSSEADFCCGAHQPQLPLGWLAGRWSFFLQRAMRSSKSINVFWYLGGWPSLRFKFLDF